MKNQKQLLLVIVVLLIIFASFIYLQFFVPPEKAFNPQIRLGNPKDGIFVANVTVLDAGIQNEDFDIKSARYAAFEYFDGKNWKLIEDLTPNLYFGEWDTPWNVTGFPSGQVKVRVVLKDVEGNEWSDELKLNINKAPESEFFVDRDESNMILDASSSIDEDGEIKEYTWLIDTNNPFEVQGQVALVPLELIPIGEEFGVMLTTTDNHGGTTVAHTLVALACLECLLQAAPKSCGCQNMDVVNTNQTQEGMEMYWMPADQNTNLGGYDNINMNQSGPFQIVHNFQVVADLAPRSDPNKCFEGQRAKGTITAGGLVSYKNGFESILNGNNSLSNGPILMDCPFGGAKWCDDDYNVTAASNASGSVKKHIGQSRIAWIDGSGRDVLYKGVILGGGYNFLGNFEAHVSGPGGSCKCNWDVNITVDANGNVLGNKIQNKNCAP